MCPSQKSVNHPQYLRSKLIFNSFITFIGQLCLQGGHLVNLLIIQCFVLIRFENIHLYNIGQIV